jgi:RNA polymerase sigma factor (sigma-70 family)
MLSALRGLPDQRDHAALKAWLFRIAHNESLTIMRRRPATDELDADTITSLAVPGGAGAAVEDRAALAALVDDLRDLPARQSHALVLRELVGLSHAEIGATLGVTEPGARQAVYEAREGLRSLERGRSMSCESIQEAISDGDGRRRRARSVRAHIATCDDCAAFAAAMDRRPAQLAMLAPALPAALASTLLANVLGAAGGGGGTSGGLLAGIHRGHVWAGAGTTGALGLVVAGALAINNAPNPAPAPIVEAATAPSRPTPPPADAPPVKKAADHPVALGGYGGPGGTTLAAVDTGAPAATEPEPTTLITAQAASPSSSQTPAGSGPTAAAALAHTGNETWLIALLGLGLLLSGAGLRFVPRRR